LGLEREAVEEAGESASASGLRLLKFVFVEGERALSDISGELCTGCGGDGREGAAEGGPYGLSLASIQALVIAGVPVSKADTAGDAGSFAGNRDDFIFSSSPALVAGRKRVSPCIEGCSGGILGVPEELEGLDIAPKSGGGSKPKNDFILLFRLLLLLDTDALSLSNLDIDGGSGGGIGGGGGGRPGDAILLVSDPFLLGFLGGIGAPDPSSSTPPSLASELSLLATLLISGNIGGASPIPLFLPTTPSLVCGRPSPSKLGLYSLRLLPDSAGLGGSSKSNVICSGLTSGFPLPADVVLECGGCGCRRGGGRNCC